MLNSIKNYYSWVRSTQKKLTEDLIGNRKYGKLVIISEARTGSTLLMHLLDKHPNILVGGEIFKKLNNNTTEEIWKEIFRKRLKRIKYVGFKLFYDHPLDGDNSVWDYIKRDKDILVIFLSRRNIFRILLSKKIGLKTKKWTKSHYDEEIKTEDKRVSLDPLEVEKGLKKIVKNEIEVRQLFKANEVINVSYEDLAEDKMKEINRIYRELGLHEFYPSTIMTKQNNEPLQDLILNYDELTRYFRDTEWIKYFDE